MSEKESDQAMLEIGLLDSQPFRLSAGLLVTGRSCLLGSSGSGKSYAVGVLCEELCRNNVPFAIVDTEGEHAGLKEKYEAIWVGEERGSDLSWNGLDLTDLANQAPDISPLILDVSDLVDYKEKVGAFLTSLYGTLSERRTPYLLILEEADKFVPQYGNRIGILEEVARRGRKRGLGLMICSQRPSLVDKNILSQCGNQLIGKLIIQNDLKSVAQFFPSRGLPKELTALKPGEFYAIGGFSATPVMVNIRRRLTRHGGVTPALAARVVKPYLGQLQSRSSQAGGVAEGLAKGKTGLGLAPSIRPEDVPVMVKREKRFKLFGPLETVTGIDLQYRTLIHLGVRLRTGIFRKKFETMYLTLDGNSGKQVFVSRGLGILRGFEKLLGLTTLQVEVLRQVSPDTDTSALDVASKLGESKATVSRALNLLNDKRLVRTIEVRKRKLFRRLVDLPNEPSEVVPMELSTVNLEKARVVPPKVREEDLRDTVKGLWEGADVESFEPFLYPVYRVELVRKRRHRQVWLDGRSGRELAL